MSSFSENITTACTVSYLNFSMNLWEMTFHGKKYSFRTFNGSRAFCCTVAWSLTQFSVVGYLVKFHCESENVNVLLTQSCPVLCDPMDCSLPGSSVHGISQARILEWIAISFSRAPSQPGAHTQVSCPVSPALQADSFFFTVAVMVTFLRLTVSAP